MSWLKDKKNQPFVLGGAIVLILASVLFMLYTNGVFQPSSNPTPPQAPISPVASYPGGASAPGSLGAPVAIKKGARRSGGYIGPPTPTASGMPPSSAPGMGGSSPMGAPSGMGASPGMGSSSGAGAASSGSAATLSALPANLSPINPAASSDPFAVSLAKAKAAGKTSIGKGLPSLLGLLPPDNIYSGVSAESQIPAADKPQPTLTAYGAQNPYQVADLPRVSGIIYDNGIYAIIQPANGEAQSVKPGDEIPGVGKVTSITSSGITVKTASGQTLPIPVSSGPPMTGGGPYGGSPYGGAPYGSPGPYGGAPYGGPGNGPPPPMGGNPGGM